MKGAVIALAAVVTTLSIVVLLQWRSRDHIVTAGFWFEEGAFELHESEAARLGGALTSEERKAIESRAWSELRAAYEGLRISFSDRRDAMYRIRVVSIVERHAWSPFRNVFGAAGESRAAWPLGGRGSVNFRLLAGNAMAYAPPNANRAAIIEGIGTGIGRAAAHEFAHQLLPTKPLDAGEDVESYEYRSAGRAEQYYGPMHWSFAWPLLVKRIGTTASSSR